MSFIITSAFVALQTLILNNREPLFYAEQKYTISFVHFHLERGRSGVSTPHVGGPSIYNNEITFFFVLALNILPLEIIQQIFVV